MRVERGERGLREGRGEGEERGGDNQRRQGVPRRCRGRNFH